MDLPSPTPEAARQDLAYIQGIVARAQQRVDPHAFHFVHWGLLVLVSYPLANVLERTGRHAWTQWLFIAVFAVGTALSLLLEGRLARRPRLPDGDAFVGHQVMWVVLISVGAALVLNVAAPLLRFIDGNAVPTLWALAYANLAAMTGIVYRREFLWSALAIFLAALAGMAWPEWSGCIVGPAMGIGLIVPGLRAERRVRAMAGR